MKKHQLGLQKYIFVLFHTVKWLIILFIKTVKVLVAMHDVAMGYLPIINLYSISYVKVVLAYRSDY